MKAEDTDSLNCLDDAKALTSGDRNRAYGDAKDNHDRIAKIWSVVFGHEVTAEEVVMCMMGLKLARLIYMPDHRDSMVDMAGYSRMLEQITCKNIKSNNSTPANSMGKGQSCSTGEPAATPEGGQLPSIRVGSD